MREKANYLFKTVFADSVRKKVENLIQELESKSIEEDIYERLSKEIEKENEDLYIK